MGEDVLEDATDRGRTLLSVVCYPSEDVVGQDRVLEDDAAEV